MSDTNTAAGASRTRALSSAATFPPTELLNLCSRVSLFDYATDAPCFRKTMTSISFRFRIANLPAGKAEKTNKVTAAMMKNARLKRGTRRGTSCSHGRKASNAASEHNDAHTDGATVR